MDTANATVAAPAEPASPDEPTTTLAGPAPIVSTYSVPLTPEDIADAAEVRAATYARDTSTGGVCVADGMGLAIRVERGALVVEDGMGDQRRARRFDKATHGLSRLVVLGTTGLWTLDALHWCRRLGIGVLVLAPDGTAALASTPRHTDDARLRRVQALAPDLPVGLDIARRLIAAKVAGQSRVAGTRFDERTAADTLDALAAAAEVAGDLDEVRELEATAAALYWQTWAGRPETAPRFAGRDRRRVPAHWGRFEGRRSVLASTNSNRRAERPINAVLNYCYALVEAEATLACHAVGLDPGLGVVHLDARGRQSLALDVMEAVRPDVDAWVLDLLAARTFRKVEFVETPDGHCRLTAPLTHDLAETLPRWSQAVAPLVEHIAHTLGRAMAGNYQPRTPLTGRHGKAAAAAVKARKTAAAGVAQTTAARQRPAGRPARPAWSCPDCGGPVANRRRVRCDTCIAADPRQTPALRASRAAAISGRRRAEAEWEAAHPGAVFDPQRFAATIRPALAAVKLSAIVAACGVTKSTASSWRTGKTTPHVSHWPALAELAGVPLPASR
jgi:CRISPR-associated endonuclease Cas1